MDITMRFISYEEVQNHTVKDSCWVILYGTVWDVTSLLSSHPGGAHAILNLAGTDATDKYDAIHAPGTLEENLPPEALLGKIGPEALPKQAEPENRPGEDASLSISPQEEQQSVALNSLLNLDDIQAVATKKLLKKSWAYYTSATDDSITKSLNNTVYQTILFRPRILLDCSRCDQATTFLGHRLSSPVYVSPTAMGRLAHPHGEWAVAQACQKFGAMQLISNFSSMQPEQIVKNAASDQVFGWQLYVQNDVVKSEKILARVEQIDAIKFICLTVDVPVTGKREDDERSKHLTANLNNCNIECAKSDSITSAKRSSSITQSLGTGNNTSLTWTKTLPWLQRHTTKPIVLKGIQTHEDAMLAAAHSDIVKGIILSNHGGRALDTAPPAIHTLMEIHRYCPEVFSQLEVLVDGGVRRGTDVVKALCLGAKAVGIGRSPLYGLAVGGILGVERVFEILQDEISTTMRLLGCETTSQLGPQCVNTAAVERDIYTITERRKLSKL